MARKMYETKEQLEKERNIADKIEKLWNCKLKKLSYKLMVDFAICKEGNIKGWIEIKTRKISSKSSHEYMISMHKMNYAFNLSKDTQLPFFLIVKFSDGLYYYKYNNEKHSLRWGGVTKAFMRDDQDREPCCYIDMKLFTKLL